MDLRSRAAGRPDGAERSVVEGVGVDPRQHGGNAVVEHAGRFPVIARTGDESGVRAGPRLAHYPLV